MDSLPPQVFIPVGVILAALIGGFFSLISLIISKEQKTSEFRQQWIDSLRQEISDHIAASITLSALRQNQSVTDEEFLKAASEDQQRVASTFTSIKLRVNPEELDEKLKKMNNAFLAKLEECRRLYNNSQWEDARKCCNALTDSAIPMLKAEWERVKRGEKVYVWARRSALGISGMALVAAIVAAAVLWPSIQEKKTNAPDSEQVQPDQNS